MVGAQKNRYENAVNYKRKKFSESCIGKVKNWKK